MHRGNLRKNRYFLLGEYPLRGRLRRISGEKLTMGCVWISGERVGKVQGLTYFCYIQNWNTARSEEKRREIAVVETGSHERNRFEPLL